LCEALVPAPRRVANGQLNAVVAVRSELALGEARALHGRVAEGEDRAVPRLVDRIWPSDHIARYEWGSEAEFKQSLQRRTIRKPVS
jgi:hypothetical protein